MDATGQNADKFERELRSVQVSLLSYINVLSGMSQDAEDILGETNLALLKHRDEYDVSRPFLPWARTFAYFTVKKWRTVHRRSRLVLDDELLDSLAGETAAAPAAGTRADDPAQDRAEALRAAMEDLTPEMKELLTQYYGQEQDLRTIGQRQHRSAHSVATSLFYIRFILRKAIARKLKEAKK